MTIRAPVQEDTDKLTDLVLEMHQESDYAFLPYDRGKVRALILQYIEDQNTRCGLVAEENQTLIGMIGGVLIEYYFCEETLVADEILFVKRERRGGRAALLLIRGLQKWAERHGARELCLSISTNIHSETTGRFYERLGFSRVGGVFKKRLNKD